MNENLVLKNQEYTYLRGIIEIKCAFSLAECLKACDFGKIDRVHINRAFLVLSDFTGSAIERLESEVVNSGLEIVDDQIIQKGGE